MMFIGSKLYLLPPVARFLLQISGFAAVTIQPIDDMNLAIEIRVEQEAARICCRYSLSGTLLHMT
jgi:hypothetical protein